MVYGQDDPEILVARDAPPLRVVRARRFGRWLAGAGCAGAFVAALALPAARVGWGPDLVANLGAFAAAGTVALLTIGVLRRRRVVIAVALGALAVHAPYAVRPRAGATERPTDLRLLIHNTHSVNPETERVADAVIAHGADVVVLVDVSPDFVRAMPGLTALSDAYPHMLRRGPVPGLTGWRIVLSRWPLEDRGTETELRCVVARPDRPFALLALHPASPRDGLRWRLGNGLVDSARDAARALEAEGLPVVVAGDLNSSPTGWRDRLLCAGDGLRRCKPRAALAGTFPAALPGPLRLALDDAWVSSAWRVCSWKTGRSAGSDHTSVLVELSLAPETAPTD